MKGTARIGWLIALAAALLFAPGADAGITGVSLVAPAPALAAEFPARFLAASPSDPFALPRLSSQYVSSSSPLAVAHVGSDAALDLSSAPGNPSTGSPMPGSMALVLSALGSLGAFQGLRATKRLPLGGFAPDWYHAEGPQQIGHATALDVTRLDVSSLALFETAFDLYLAARALGASAAPEFTPPKSQSILLIESPRAPPSR